jgi:Flp pilus assembly protein TadD
MEALVPVYQFGVMVIKKDDFHEEAENGVREDCLEDIANAVGRRCQEENGMWCPIEQNLFACFFPDKSATACLFVAKDIQNRISVLRKDTVSIGIAAYPTINYQKDQVLENARKALNHASFFGPNSIVTFDSVSLNISGDNRYAEGDIDGAIEEFMKALMLDPTNANVRNSLGVCYGVLGDLDKAREEFEVAVWLEPREFMAIYNIGMVHLLKGEKHAALEFFLEAGNACGNVLEVQLQTGRVYVEIGKHKDAKKYLEAAVKLQPTSASAFRYLGECYGTLGRVDDAISAYKSAIKLNPNDAESLSALGHLFDLQGENPEISTAFCLQSVEISPENGLYRHRLGSLYLKQNRYEEALREFETARKLGYDSVQHIEHIYNRLAAGAS